MKVFELALVRAFLVIAVFAAPATVRANGLTDDVGSTFSGMECFDQEHSRAPGYPIRVRIYFRQDMGAWIFDWSEPGRQSWGLNLGRLTKVDGGKVEFSYAIVNRDTNPWTLDFYGQAGPAGGGQSTRYTLLEQCQSFEGGTIIWPRRASPRRTDRPR